MSFESVDDILSEMFEINPTEEVIDMADFLFEGFDPETILKELMSIAKKKKVKKDDFRTEMCTIIAICCNRGPINKKVMSRMKEEGKTRVLELVAKYVIKIDVPAQQLSRTDITPSRIVNVFPFITIDICAKSDWARYFQGPFNSAELPSAMINTSFASCIPTGTPATELLFKAYMLFVMDLADVTSNGLDPDQYGAIYTKQMNYTKAAMNAKLFKNEFRVKKLKEHSFHSKDSYSTFVRLVNAFCKIMSWTYSPPSFSDYSSAFK
jgi:hypothetical protein